MVTECPWNDILTLTLIFFSFDKLVVFLSNAGITLKKKEYTKAEVILNKGSSELLNKWLYCKTCFCSFWFPSNN